MSAAPSPPPFGAAQVDVDPSDVGAAEVADDDVVGAAEGAELDVLDVVEIHRDVGDVAGEEHASAVGRDVDVLGDVGAEEQHRVGAVLALDGVVAVARVPLEHVVAGAHAARRRCRCRRRRSRCRRRRAIVSAPWLPRIVSLPAPPSSVSLMTPAGSVVAVMPSLPPSAVDRRASRWRLPRPVMLTCAGQADAPTTEVPAPKTSMMSSPLVPLTITVSAAASPAVPPIVPARLTLTSVTSVPVRSLTVIVSAPPSALRLIVSTSFRSMTMLPMLRVKRTRPPLAETSKFSAMCAAVEQHRVGAVLALDRVAAVARIPLERVVAGAEEGGVVALLAVDEVVAVAAEQGVVAVAAEDGVVAGAAVDRELDQRREIAGGAENVSSPPFMLTTRFSVVPMSRENGAGLTRSKRTRVPFAVTREHLGAVAAVDFGRVVAGAAFHQVAVVAGIPDHAVVAGLAEHLIVGVAAGQRVVAGAAEQEVEAALAEQRVVAAPGRTAGRRPSRR